MKKYFLSFLMLGFLSFNVFAFDNANNSDEYCSNHELISEIDQVNSIVNFSGNGSIRDEYNDLYHFTPPVDGTYEISINSPKKINIKAGTGCRGNQFFRDDSGRTSKSTSFEVNANEQVYLSIWQYNDGQRDNYTLDITFTPVENILLTGILRDFNERHVDFEPHASWENGLYSGEYRFYDGKQDGLETNNVLAVLGADKKPQINPNSRHNFKPKRLDEWFNDIEGVNMSTPHSIILYKNRDDLYEFSSGAFFPADGKLFGKENHHGRSYDHNFHMTYELHTRFTYQNGQEFDFRGDDDVWVFINNELIIDLGGIHSAQSQSVHLNTLGLVEGDSYALDFFWAERHSTGSNFKITTSIELEVQAPMPSIRIDDNSTYEGNDGEQKDLNFLVSLDKVATKDVGFWFTVTDGSDGSDGEYAEAILDDNDMDGDSSYLIIPAGSQSLIISVKVNGDNRVEPDERFFVDIYEVENANVDDDRAEGIILNDDSIGVTILDSEVIEGDSRSNIMEFRVTFDQQTDKAYTLSYQTSDGTANSTEDYQAKAVDLWTIPANSSSATLNIEILGDENVEDNETLLLSLFSPSSGLVIIDGDAVGTIIDNDVEVNLNSNLVANYHFDECSWDGSREEVKDSSESNFHGKAKEDVTTVVEGKLSRSALFDGTNYVNTGDILNDLLGYRNNSFTITAWIKPEILTNTKTNHETKNTFIAKASDARNDNLEIGVNLDGSLHLYLDTRNIDKYADFGSGITVGSWHFIAVSYRNGSVNVHIDENVYRNGITWSDANDIDQAVTSPFTIGASLHIDNYFQGNIDEVKVFDRALNRSEVETIFENESNGLNYDGTSRDVPSCLNTWICDGTLYLSNANEIGVGATTDDMYLHSINRDINPFSFPSLGSSYSKTYNATAYNPRDNYMYAMYGNELLRIGQNAEIEYLGVVEGLDHNQSYSGAFDRDGYYYIGNWNHKELIYKIDIENKEVDATIEISYGFEYWDMTIDQSGDYLYMINVSNGKLIQVKISDGSIIEIGINSNRKEVASIYSDIQGRVFTILNGGGFYEVDSNNGDRYFISQTPQLTSLNDGANCPDGSIGFSDYGDAPESYGDPRHGIIQSLKLGEEIDHESQSRHSLEADGDDSGDNHDDEDGIDMNLLPTLIETNALYSIENISVYNDTGSDAYLMGWIDFDENGLFDDDEKTYTPVPTGTQANIGLTWQVTSDIRASASYLRVRLSRDVNLSAMDESSFGEVEDYEIDIKKANIFDVWDVDENINHRSIKTKKVNEAFSLNIVSLSQENNESMENFYRDIVQIGLFEGSTKIYDYQDVNLSAGSNVVLFDNILMSYKNVYATIRYTDDFNITREVNSTDSFAIRPSTYKIIPKYIIPAIQYKAGEEFNITIEALDHVGNRILNYAESFYILDYEESNSGCVKGILDFSQTAFNSGKAWFIAKYSEIGKLDLNVSEIVTQEFALIDKNDGSDDDRFIEYNSINITILPANIDMSWDFQNSSGLYSYYSRTPLEVGAQLDVNVSIKNSSGALVENFKNGCYSEDVDIKINYLTEGGLPIDPLIIDLNSSHESVSGAMDTASIINYKLEKELFSNGNAFKHLKINFDRDSSIVREPMTLTLTDINASILGGERSEDSTDQSAKFLYVRANAPTQSVDGKELNATIYYEAYCKNCNKNSFGLETLEESIDSIYWYILEDDSLSFGIGSTPKALYYASCSTNEKDRVTIKVDKTPHQDKIIYKPFTWLVYNRFNPSETQHSFKVEFSAKAEEWGGQGELGFTVDHDVSSLGYSKMDW